MSHIPCKPLAWASACAAALAGLLAVSQASAQSADTSAEAVRSSPKDMTSYSRDAVAGEAQRSPRHPKVFLRNVVVSNTDPTLRNTDTFNDGETSIAINPLNHDEIVITSFAGGWGTGTFAPLWHSTDRGATWTKRFTFARPTGVFTDGRCPCDQTFDYSSNGILTGTVLTVPTNVYTGITTNPADPSAWQWLAPGGVAARTNQVAVNIADQPWVLVNRDPVLLGIENTYVAYDDFSTGPDMRVAVSRGTSPPGFVTDVRTGISTAFVNPGHRMAKNTIDGTVYSLFQRRIAPGEGGSQRIDYMLNRSTDGGVTWPLGAGNGIVVATADSTQPRPKFGTVNALLGGALHAAVHSQSGALYYVYGNRDPATGNNRLAIRRITQDANGDPVIGPETFVTGQVQAALPSVAVTPNGEVGVFYYTFDGLDASGFPTFTAHVAISSDQGATFNDTALMSFLSSAKDNGDPRQRVLGDYMQMKAAGGTFYGAFTANGVAFGRPFANHDPIFFRVQATGPR